MYQIPQNQIKVLTAHTEINFAPLCAVGFYYTSFHATHCHNIYAAFIL
jgi:hypothetical protein